MTFYTALWYFICSCLVFSREVEQCYFFLFSVEDKFCMNLFPMFYALNWLSFNSWICWKITKLFLAIKLTMRSQKWWDSWNPVRPLYLWTAKKNNIQKPRNILALKWVCALLTLSEIIENCWLNTKEQTWKRRSTQAQIVESVYN